MAQSQAEAAISLKLSTLQGRAKELFHGQEKLAIIEVVRTLDHIAALALIGAPLTPEQRLSDYYARCGTAAALQPLLPHAESAGIGVPWQRSEEHTTSFFYAYLVTCGKLQELLRLARLERYGLARTEVAPNRVDIFVQPDTHERRVRNLSWATRRPEAKDIEFNVPNVLLERMREYVQSDEEYFIRYDNDWKIVDEYLERAKRYARGFLEAEALPDDFIIGGRPFSDWKLACEKALGRALLHIDFALILCEKCPATSLRDVLTMPVRKEDAAVVWLESGLDTDGVGPIMRALTLQSEDLAGWRDSFEIPTCHYVVLGPDFLLLPSFGSLLNPYYSLFRHLRTVYRTDWDRGVDLREGVFRMDLGKLFSGEKFWVPPHGYKIKRADGSHLTDVDAVICDRETGSLALLQLKWHDIYGRSLSERESRRKNLATAMEWVERLQSWIEGRSSREIADALGLQIACSQAAPELYVVARYAAQFEGDGRDDHGATWLSWPELVALKEVNEGTDPIREIPRTVSKLAGTDDSPAIPTTTHQFQDLTVTVHVGKG